MQPDDVDPVLPEGDIAVVTGAGAGGAATDGNGIQSNSTTIWFPQLGHASASYRYPTK